jgi:hypothetical protein
VWEIYQRQTSSKKECLGQTPGEQYCKSGYAGWNVECQTQDKASTTKLFNSMLALRIDRFNVIPAPACHYLYIASPPHAVGCTVVLGVGQLEVPGA